MGAETASHSNSPSPDDTMPRRQRRRSGRFTVKYDQDWPPRGRQGGPRDAESWEFYLTESEEGASEDFSPYNDTQNPHGYSEETLAAPSIVIPPTPRVEPSDHDSWHVVEYGRAGTLRYRLLLADKKGHIVSPWHDIPLHPTPPRFPSSPLSPLSPPSPSSPSSTPPTIVRFVCTTPIGTWLQCHVAAQEPFSPLKMKSTRGWPSHYPDNVAWNLGFLPQTWSGSHCRIRGSRASPPAGVPLEAIDLGTRAAWTGEVYRLKVLAAVMVVEEGRRLVWRVVGIAEDDVMATMVRGLYDVSTFMPGKMETVQAWLQMANSSVSKRSGPPLSGQAADEKAAVQVVQRAHATWRLHMAPNQQSEETVPMRASDYEATWQASTGRQADYSMPLCKQHDTPAKRYEHAWMQASGNTGFSSGGGGGYTNSGSRDAYFSSSDVSDVSSSITHVVEGRLKDLVNSKDESREGMWGRFWKTPSTESSVDHTPMLERAQGAFVRVLSNGLDVGSWRSGKGDQTPKQSSTPKSGKPRRSRRHSLDETAMRTFRESPQNVSRPNRNSVDSRFDTGLTEDVLRDEQKWEQKRVTGEIHPHLIAQWEELRTLKMRMNGGGGQAETNQENVSVQIAHEQKSAKKENMSEYGVFDEFSKSSRGSNAGLQMRSPKDETERGDQVKFLDRAKGILVKIAGEMEKGGNSVASLFSVKQGTSQNPKYKKSTTLGRRHSLDEAAIHSMAQESPINSRGSIKSVDKHANRSRIRRPLESLSNLGFLSPLNKIQNKFQTPEQNPGFKLSTIGRRHSLDEASILRMTQDSPTPNRVGLTGQESPSIFRVDRTAPESPRFFRGRRKSVDGKSPGKSREKSARKSREKSTGKGREKSTEKRREKSTEKVAFRDRARGAFERVTSGTFGISTLINRFQSPSRDPTPKKSTLSRRHSLDEASILRMAQESPNIYRANQMGQESPNVYRVGRMGQESPTVYGMGRMGQESPSVFRVGRMGQESPAYGIGRMGQESPTVFRVGRMGQESPGYGMGRMGQESPTVYREDKKPVDVMTGKTSVNAEKGSRKSRKSAEGRWGTGKSREKSTDKSKERGTDKMAFRDRAREAFGRVASGTLSMVTRSPARESFVPRKSTRGRRHSLDESAISQTTENSSSNLSPLPIQIPVSILRREVLKEENRDESLYEKVPTESAKKNAFRERARGALGRVARGNFGGNKKRQIQVPQQNFERVDSDISTNSFDSSEFNNSTQGKISSSDGSAIHRLTESSSISSPGNRYFAEDNHAEDHNFVSSEEGFVFRQNPKPLYVPENVELHPQLSFEWEELRVLAKEMEMSGEQDEEETVSATCQPMSGGDVPDQQRSTEEERREKSSLLRLSSHISRLRNQQVMAEELFRPSYSLGEFYTLREEIEEIY